MGLMVLLLSMLATGCNKQVITVAGMEPKEQTQEPVNYIEISEFELKKPKAEYKGKDVLFCAVLIPEGFKESEEIPGMYIHERYPIEASNIYYSVSEGNAEGAISDELSGKMYEELVEEAFAKAGEEVDLEMDSFEQTEMEGVPVYKICSSYAKDSKRVQQLTYLIPAEDTHIVTYTQMSDDEMMDDYTTTEGQIKLVISQKTD